jgi:hypothetical protein
MVGYSDKARDAACRPILTSAARDVQIYRQALADEDFETLRTLGHKMKGTGSASAISLTHS